MSYLPLLLIFLLLPDSISLIDTSNSSNIPTHFSPVNLNTQVMLSPVSPQQSSIISYTPLTITNQLITSELHPVRRCFRRLSSENIIFNLEDSQTSVSNNVNDRLFLQAFDEQGAFIHSTPTPTKSVHWAPSIKLEEIITPCSDNETVAQRTRQKKPHISPELPWVQDTVVICTLESIDPIKSLKRSPQHIFVEVLGPGSGFRFPGFQVPESNFRVSSSGLRTLFHG
ncbi:hypothetical protein Avbf_13752 [Armadillidium vulgare]|nr:hypothetical protein Avbf_13752 [Armadillidium vulgare]